MSNKVVPQIYAGIIDDVVNSIRDKFEEEGLDEDGALVLRKLWEANLRLTRVAPFQTEEESPEPESASYGQQNSDYADQKPFIMDQGNGSYYGGLKGGSMRLRGGASSEDEEEYDEELEDEDVKPFVAGASSGKIDPNEVAQLKNLARLGNDSAPGAIPPTRDSRGALISRDPDMRPNENGIYPGEEIIGSDLDDSDQEDDDGLIEDDEDEDQDDLTKDVMICVCDKVQRVKNKWKVTFKDGFIRANGKEYVFSRCTGEFEW